jgi:hypothetical protein
MNRLKIIAAIAATALAFAAAAVSAKGKSSASQKTDNADYRSAKSGQYTKKGYAEKNKSTTVREERKKK